MKGQCCILQHYVLHVKIVMINIYNGIGKLLALHLVYPSHLELTFTKLLFTFPSVVEMTLVTGSPLRLM